jgi:hypothetical protein
MDLVELGARSIDLVDQEFLELGCLAEKTGVELFFWIWSCVELSQTHSNYDGGAHPIYLSIYVQNRRQQHMMRVQRPFPGHQRRGDHQTKPLWCVATVSRMGGLATPTTTPDYHHHSSPENQKIIK